MITSGCGRRMGYVGRWCSSSHISLNVQCRVWTVEFAGDVKRQVRRVVTTSEVVDAMVERGHLALDCRCIGRLLGRSHGGYGGSRTGAEGEDPGELLFRKEKFAEETRAVMRLEGELNATLMFEHGGHQLASPLWSVRSLLGHLFRERVALGKTVKVFSKHYRKEVMRGLVKIQDLMDLA